MQGSQIGKATSQALRERESALCSAACGDLTPQDYAEWEAISRELDRRWAWGSALSNFHPATDGTIVI